jgi:hypothetical protein
MKVVLNPVKQEKEIYMKIRPHLITSTSVQKNINLNSYNCLIKVF